MINPLEWLQRQFFRQLAIKTMMTKVPTEDEKVILQGRAALPSTEGGFEPIIVLTTYQINQGNKSVNQVKHKKYQSLYLSTSFIKEPYDKIKKPSYQTLLYCVSPNCMYTVHIKMLFPYPLLKQFNIGHIGIVSTLVMRYAIHVICMKDYLMSQRNHFGN